MKSRQQIKPLRINYKLNPKTQDVKLYFSQGSKQYCLTWEDSKNNWENLIKWCKDMEEDMFFNEYADFTIFCSGNNNKVLIADADCSVQGDDTYTENLFITSAGWQEKRGKKQWVRTKKIFASFDVSWPEICKQLYSVVSDLACNPKYTGANKRYTKESKYNLLSQDLAKILPAGDWYTDYSRQVLRCLKNSTFCATDYYNRGLSLYNLKRYKAALKDFNTALRKKKDLVQDTIVWCYRERGRVYKALKQYKKAGKDFLTANKLNPEYTAAYRSLACLYSDIQKYDKALSWELKELKLNPEDSDLLYNLGLSYNRKKQWKKALNFFKKSYEQYKDAASLLRICFCRIKMRQFKEGKKICNELLKKLTNREIFFKYPKTDHKLLLMLSKEYLKLKEYDLAISLAQEGKNFGFKGGYGKLIKQINKARSKVQITPEPL